MKSVFVTRDNVKLLGRTLDNNGERWLIHSASGIEFTTTTKELSFTLIGDYTSREPRMSDGSLRVTLSRYEIYLDGQLCVSGLMDAVEKTVSVFCGSEERTVTVTLIKLSEGSQSYMGIKCVNVSDQSILVPTKQKPFKIEFIGDSITCGFGIESKSEQEAFTTQTENATKTYAYLAAKALDADCSFASFSGFGVVSGWTDDGTRNDIQKVPPHYEKFCFCWDSDLFSDRTWDFSSFVPNLVVVNLGTNDVSYTQNDKTRLDEFISCYVDFIKLIRLHNPSAHILLTLGIMTGGNPLIPYVKKVAQEYTKLTGDKNVSTYDFISQKAEEGLASYGHPTLATHERCAKELSAHIKNLIADKKIVFDKEEIPYKTLIQKAREMLSFSYSPYSNYRVGAALLTTDDKIYTGCNIENVAFGPSNCAERTAFFKAVSEGKKSFKAIAIIGGPEGNPVDYCTPCGVCRQVMIEFCTHDFIIIMAKSEDDFKVKTLGELLPESFCPQEQVGQSSVR